MSKILVGSQYFFSCYNDFHSKDIDELELIDTTEFKQIRQFTGNGRCLFQLKKHNSKNEYIDWALRCGLGMAIGKFLVPEFCKQIGFEINDLPQLQPLLEHLDERHQYEKIIYDSYIKNGDFILTNEQRDEAYASYKSSRRE